MWAIEQSKFGYFFGCHLSAEDLAYLAAKQQCASRSGQQAFAEIEIDLMDRKWFDYRYMPPTLATYLFARHYDLACRDAYRKHIDKKEAPFINGYVGDPLIQQSAATGFWKARQAADRLGMPYRLYVMFAVERAMQYRRPYLPRPQQLYSEAQLLDAHEKWEERTATRFYPARDPRYRIENYRGTREQTGYRAYILEQAGRRQHPEHLLAKAVHDMNALPIAEVDEWFGPEMVGKVMAIGATGPGVSEPVATAA